MKKQVRKIFLTALAVFAAFIVSGQANGKFYASFEDYQNDKPVEGIEVASHSWRSDYVDVISKGKTEKKKVLSMPYDFFTYDNFLMRRYKDKWYIVLVSGPLCYYVWNNDQALQYYSETIKGDLVKYSDSVLKKYLEKYGLLDDYKNDKPKRQFKDSVNDYYNKEVARNVKYFKLVNEKMK